MRVEKLFAVVIAMAVVTAMGLVLVFVAQPDAVQADAPAAPTDLSARNAWVILPTNAEEGITLSWTAPEGTITGYRILRQRSGCDDALVVHVENTGSDEATYTDRDVVGGVTYVYRVKAINSDDVGPQSDAVTFEYGGNFLAELGDDSGPERPTGLDAWNVTRGIQLKWQTPDGTPTGYQILRRPPGNCEAFQVHTENTGSTSAFWMDPDVEVGTRYEYRVVGINRFGRGSQSDSIEITRKRLRPWGTIYSIFPGYTFEGFLNSYGTMAVGRLELDDDPDTVDYTWRGDVTRDSDGADADSCEGDGLGEDREVTVVTSRTTMFDFTFGGADCRVGDYTITYVVHDRNGNEERSGTMGHDVIGVTIDGRAQVGETLSADVSTISNTDDFAGTTFIYEWYRYDSDEDSYAAIQDATSSTYTVVAGDVGKTIMVMAEFTDIIGQRSGRASFPTAAVVPANSAPTGAPTISGTLQVGETITADTSGISDTDGLRNVSYSYLWISNDSDIQDATASTYTLTAADQGKTIKVNVSFTDDNGNEETLTSAATAEVDPATAEQGSGNSAATGAPTIGGTVQVGQTLTASTSGFADADGLTNASYSYQWIANDGTSDSDIQEATSSSYTLVSGDVDKTIKVKVSFTDDAENEETLTSAATAAVAAAVPGATGDLTVSVNDTGKLDLSWDAPDDDGGSAVTGYKVQWKESSDSWNTPADVSETTVTGTSHTVSGLTDGAEYTFRVVAVNSAGDGTTSAEESGTPRETTAPSVSSASVDGTTLTVTFSEDLTESPVPATTTFTVTVGQDDRGVDSVAVAGNTVTLTLASAVIAGDQVAAGYTAPTEQAAAMLKDLNENPAESFSGQTATNNTAASLPALTASSHDVPSSHDGQTEFTFELRFSANVTGLSYKTLRDHAFTVTGGEVVQARRLEAGKNVRWEISVTPNGDSPITIVLPATTDCEAYGAVCTDGGRKLSQGLEFEVPGLSTPEITSGSSFSVEEGATEVATLRATDGDTPAANLTWSVSGGNDEAKFAVTAAGELSFAAAKDYETPDDADTDGVYEVTVQVSDGGRTDSAELTVTLTNVNEAPTADAGADQENVIQGDTVTLNGSGTDPESGDTLSYTWTQSGTPAVTLSDSAVESPAFTAPTGLSADTALTFTLRVTDSGSLYAEDSVTVTINGQLPLTPLTASTHGVPAAHDGSTTFTFELRFSEEPADGFSYKTLRDNAFTVTSGEVVKARRLEKGKNVRWEISVTPDGDGAVTIVLPATTDCEASGAVCTDGGRKLSNRLDLTVSGPE